MPLVIVNPSPSPKRRKRRTTTTPARKRAATKGVTVAKRRRSPAQMRAFRKMISTNPHHRRKRRTVRNPAPARRAVRRRYHNPSPVRHFRRRRNPSGGGGDMFRSLLSTEGLIMAAAIAGTPTLGALLMTQFLPSLTGYTKYATQAGVGIGVGWLVHKFLHKEAGKMIALVSVGNGVAQLIQVYQGTLQGYQVLSGRALPNGQVTLAGYVPMGRNDGNMNGVPMEPGLVRI